MDGIDTTDLDGVVPPSPINKTQIPVVLETNVDNPQPDSPEVTPEFLEALPEMDVSFKIVSDQAEKLVDMETIEGDIIGDDTISQPKAEELGMAFESFFKGPIRLNEFTKTPSKVNFQYAKKHMAGSIKLAQESLVSSFGLFVDEPLNCSIQALEKIREVYLPDIQERCAFLQSAAVAILPQFSTNKDLVVPYKDVRTPGVDSFVNIGTMDIMLLDIDCILSPKKDLTVIKAAVQNIQNLLSKNHVLRSLLWSSTQDGSLEACMTPEAQIKSAGFTTSINGLFTFFAHPLLNRLFDDLDESLYENIEAVKKVQEDGLKIQGDVKLVQDFVVSNGKELQALNKAMHEFCGVVSTLLLLIPNVSELAEVFTDY